MGAQEEGGGGDGHEGPPRDQGAQQEQDIWQVLYFHQVFFIRTLLFLSDK